MYYAVGMISGIAAVFSFAVQGRYFIMGAGIGLTLTVYIIHPTTSFSFFICLLAGVGSLGAMRDEVTRVGNQYSGWYLKWLFCCQAGKNGGNHFEIFSINSPLWEC